MVETVSICSGQDVFCQMSDVFSVYFF